MLFRSCGASSIQRRHVEPTLGAPKSRRPPGPAPSGDARCRPGPQFGRARRLLQTLRVVVPAVGGVPDQMSPGQASTLGRTHPASARTRLLGAGREAQPTRPRKGHAGIACRRSPSSRSLRWARRQRTAARSRSNLALVTPSARPGAFAGVGPSRPPARHVPHCRGAGRPEPDQWYGHSLWTGNGMSSPMPRPVRPSWSPT